MIAWQSKWPNHKTRHPYWDKQDSVEMDAVITTIVPFAHSVFSMF